MSVKPGEEFRVASLGGRTLILIRGADGDRIEEDGEVVWRRDQSSTPTDGQSSPTPSPPRDVTDESSLPAKSPESAGGSKSGSRTKVVWTTKNGGSRGVS